MSSKIQLEWELPEEIDPDLRDDLVRCTPLSLRQSSRRMPSYSTINALMAGGFRLKASDYDAILKACGEA